MPGHRGNIKLSLLEISIPTILEELQPPRLLSPLPKSPLIEMKDIIKEVPKQRISTDLKEKLH